MTDWRELARRNVPFDQWPMDAKLAAMHDHAIAVLRSIPTQEDWELFKLQHPYIADLARFYPTITMTILTPDYGQATPVGLLQYETPVGSRIRWGADVSHFGAPASGGDVIFELFGSLGQVDLKRVRLTGGVATYTTVKLPKSRYMLRARYEPLDTGLTPSAQLVFLTVQ